MDVMAVALAVAAGATLGALCRRYRRETRTAAARLAAGSRVVETACGPVEYAVVGAGPPALVVHGGGGGYDQGLLFARFLGLSDRFRCVAVSRFGYLRSPLPGDGDASLTAQADAYAALLDALNLPRVILAAGSAGGPSGLQFALRYPERCTALVLISALSEAWAWPDLPPGAERLLRNSGFVLWSLVNFAPRVLLSAFGITRQALARANPDERAWLREVLQTLLPVSLRWAGMANDANQLGRLERTPLECIRTPALVIHAVDDVLAPFAQGQSTAQAIPGARLIALNSGGHLWLGQQEMIVSAIKKFAPG